MTLEDLFLAWDFLCLMVLRIASSRAQVSNVAVVAPLVIFSNHFPRTSLRTQEYVNHCCLLSDPEKGLPLLSRHRKQGNIFPPFRALFRLLFFRYQSWSPPTSAMTLTSICLGPHQHQPWPSPALAMTLMGGRYRVGCLRIKLLLLLILDVKVLPSPLSTK